MVATVHKAGCRWSGPAHADIPPFPRPMDFRNPQRPASIPVPVPTPERQAEDWPRTWSTWGSARRSPRRANSRHRRAVGFARCDGSRSASPASRHDGVSKRYKQLPRSVDGLATSADDHPNHAECVLGRRPVEHEPRRYRRTRSALSSSVAAQIQRCLPRAPYDRHLRDPDPCGDPARRALRELNLNLSDALEAAA